MSKGRDWRKVGEIVAKVRELGLSFKDGAKRFGMKPWVLYDYNKKAKHESKEAASTAKRDTHGDGGDPEIPKNTTGETPVGLPGDIADLICTYRREHPDHGFKRIQDILKEKYLVVVTRKHIRKVLKDAGLLETCNSSFDVEKLSAKGTRRFEAKHPREIWQMDVTYVYINTIPVLYLIIIIDDHSRYCVAAELRRDQRVETLIGVLHDACTLYGPPEKLLTDQASGFYSWSHEQTRFQEYLDDRRIEHIVAEPHSPQTQGKVERLIQTIREELLRKVKFTGFEDAAAQIRSYVNSYNTDRPHQGIQGRRAGGSLLWSGGRNRTGGITTVNARAGSFARLRDLQSSRTPSLRGWGG